MSNIATDKAHADVMRIMNERMKDSRPKPRTGPVKCEDCGNEWIECTCGEGITRNLFAFHDQIGGTYKVWKCEDTVFLEHEHDSRSQSVIMLPYEFTRIAQTWLAMQDEDGTIHEHVYESTFDPRYAVCSCGIAQHVPDER